MNNVTKALLVVILFVFYKYAGSLNQNLVQKLKPLDYLIALYFSCALVMMRYPNYIFSIIESRELILKSCVSVVGYMLFIIVGMNMIYEHLYRYAISGEQSISAMTPKKVFRDVFIVVFVLGIPYLIAFYPGSVFTDMFYQISEYYSGNITNHHPILTTFLYGTMVKAGSFVNDNFGIFCACFFQYVVFALSVGYLLTLLYRLTGNLKSVLLGTAFYVLVPVFYHFSYMLVKVSLYAFVFTVLCCFIIKFFYQGDWSKRNLLIFLLLNVLIVLIRKEGIYVSLITLVCTLVFASKQKKTRMLISCMLVAIVLLNAGYHNVLLPSLQIAEGSKRESLSIPLLQTALYIRDAGDEITEDERKVLQDCFGDNLEEIGALYDPTISDNVKGRFNPTESEELYTDYLRIWLKMGIKHPGIYAKAFLGHISSYIFPEGYRTWYIFADINSLGDEYKSPYLNVSNSSSTEFLRNAYRDYTSLFLKIPLLSLLSAPGFYTWIYLLLFGITAHLPNKKYLLAFAPLICVIGVCCMSPVNGYTRYFLPVEMVLPIYIGYVIKLYVTHIQNSNQTTVNDESEVERV